MYLLSYGINYQVNGRKWAGLIRRLRLSLPLRRKRCFQFRWQRPFQVGSERLQFLCRSH